jgi:hypothetical protein
MWAICSQSLAMVSGGQAVAVRKGKSAGSVHCGHKVLVEDALGIENLLPDEFFRQTADDFLSLFRIQLGKGIVYAIPIQG